MENKQSRLSGYQLVPKGTKPHFIEVPTFPEGQFGQVFLELYNERVVKDFNSNPVLNVLNYNPKNRMVEGSNPYAAVLAGQIVAELGLRVASPAELEEILSRKELPLSGVYVDTGLVFRTEGNPNEYIAKSTKSQLEGRGINNFEVPYLGLTAK